MSRRQAGSYIAREDAIKYPAVTATSIGAKYARKPRTRQPSAVCVTYQQGEREKARVFSKNRTTERRREVTVVRALRTEREEQKIKLLRIAGYIGDVD